MENTPVLGVIGGSGLYGLKDLEDIETIDIDTPFGSPSSPIMLGTLLGKRIAFLARHGIGHFLTPGSPRSIIVPTSTPSNPWACTMSSA